MEKTKVVIVGGTGYLGQHLLQAFAGKNGVDRYDVAFTHHSSPLPRLLLHAFPHFPAFLVTLKTGLGFHSISQDFGQMIKHMRLVLNAGGPDILSRVQMAEVVAEVRGHDLSLIKHVSASSVDRGVVSPADISMDITKLIQTLQISPTSFKDGVRLTLQSESHSHILS